MLDHKFTIKNVFLNKHMNLIHKHNLKFIKEDLGNNSIEITVYFNNASSKEAFIRELHIL